MSWQDIQMLSSERLAFPFCKSRKGLCAKQLLNRVSFTQVFDVQRTAATEEWSRVTAGAEL